MQKDWAEEEEGGGSKVGWFLNCLWGGVVAVVVCGGIAAAISLMLPPPEPRDWSKPDPGPVVIDGIEVSSEPAYSGSGSGDAQEGAEPDAVASTGDGEAAAAGDQPATPAPITPTLAADGTPSIARLEALGGFAISVNAMPFELPADMPLETPLVAVVIGNAGANPAIQAELLTLPYPATVGIVAGEPGDEETASAAQAIGLEVVAELPILAAGEGHGVLLEEGLPVDEVVGRTLVMMERLPMAVAGTWAETTGAKLDGPLLQGIGKALGAYGFAYLDRGVPPGEASEAELMEFPTLVAVSHFAIPAAAAAPEVQSALDAVAEAAAARGGAVVFVPAETAALQAVQQWLDAGAAKNLRVAPLSVVISRLAAG